MEWDTEENNKTCLKKKGFHHGTTAQTYLPGGGTFLGRNSVTNSYILLAVHLHQDLQPTHVTTELLRIMLYSVSAFLIFQVNNAVKWCLTDPKVGGEKKRVDASSLLLVAGLNKKCFAQITLSRFQHRKFCLRKSKAGRNKSRGQMGSRSVTSG